MENIKAPPTPTTASPWDGYISSRLIETPPSAFDDFHDWGAWLRWKLVDHKTITDMLDDCDRTAAVGLYCVMRDLIKSEDSDHACAVLPKLVEALSKSMLWSDRDSDEEKEATYALCIDALNAASGGPTK